MKIYTRRGDGGETGFFGGGRIPKDDPRVEAYGSVDELSTSIGLARLHVADAATRERLGALQADLFAIGAHLATPPPRPGRRPPELPELPATRVADLESWIDAAAGVCAPLRNFVLPGGSEGACHLHAARAVCRRAERRVAALAGRSQVAGEITSYLNRLSDYLFAAARLENHRAGRGDVEWQGGA